jgi:hypothetical protein
MFTQSLQLISIDAAQQFEQTRTSLDDGFNNLLVGLAKEFGITSENLMVVQTEKINNRKFVEENKNTLYDIVRLLEKIDKEVLKIGKRPAQS